MFDLSMVFLTVSTASSSPARSYSSALRRYPYLTDVVGSYTTIHWATDTPTATLSATDTLTVTPTLVEPMATETATVTVEPSQTSTPTVTGIPTQ